jgi:hypothetical protein
VCRNRFPHRYDKEKALMSTKEAQEKLVSNMKQWQKVENASVASTAQIIEKTENPLVRLVMEIIQRDSQMHYRVQDLIVSSLEQKAISLSPEELADVWGMIEKHIEIEKNTIALAEESATTLAGTSMIVQRYLLGYLLEDERKHNNMLAALESIKAGMYPYAS